VSKLRMHGALSPFPLHSFMALYFRYRNIFTFHPTIYLPQGTEESHEKLQLGRLSPDQDLNLGPLKYRVGILTTTS
jgi:hypothetical protein